MATLGAARISRLGSKATLVWFAWVFIAFAGSGVRSAYAICDVIPGPTAEFRGALGTLNRPFAIPGVTGEQIKITLDFAGCDSASGGFLDLGGAAGAEDDYFVTLLFEPPNGARNAIVLTTSGNLTACTSAVANALPALGGGSASCRVVPPGTLQLRVPSPSELELRFPDTDADLAPDGDDLTFTGPTTVAVTAVAAPVPFGLASARCADTPGLVACVDELYPDDGTCDNSAAHVDPIFGHFTALPPANDYRTLCNTPGTECLPSNADLRFAIDKAGSALVPVDWRGVLLRPDDIPVPRLLRGTTSFPAFTGGGAVRIPGRSFLASYGPSGRRVAPIFDPLFDPNASSNLALFGSVDASIGVMRFARRLPNDSGVYQECNAGAHDGLPCVSAEDCPAGTCGPTFCYQPNGTATSTACTRDAQCTGGNVCGPSVFDFSDRLAISGTAPVLIASDDYDLDAENPAPLEGLLETPTLFAFLELEAIAGSSGTGFTPEDLNGDGDTTDAVLVLRDRKTGITTPIGVSSNPGRAATRVREPPFSTPSLAVEGDVAALLESEPLQDDLDANLDGDVFDSVLHVYRRADGCGPLGAPCAQELTSGAPIAIDPEPAIDGKNLVISGGLVFFRVSEAADAQQSTLNVTAGADGPSYYGGLNRSGRFVGFTSNATNLLGPGGDTNGNVDGFAYDQDDDGDGVFLEPGEGTIVRLTVDTFGNEVPCTILTDPTSPQRCNVGGQLTPDGRFSLFNSEEPILTFECSTFGTRCPNDPLPITPQVPWDVFVRDRDTDQDGILDETGAIKTSVVSVNDQEQEANANMGATGMTPDGRFVIMSGRATNLTPIHPSSTENVFLHDRDVSGDGMFDEAGDIRTTLLSVDADGNAVPGQSSPSVISDDGRYIAFVSNAIVVPGDTNGVEDTFLRDRDADGDGLFDEWSQVTPSGVTTTRISLGAFGEEGNAPSSSNPKMSSDARSVLFSSDASNLVPGDTNAVRDAFVKDTANGQITRATVASDGAQSDGPEVATVLSANGRFVAFESEATNLVAGDVNGLGDVFLHDRLTGHTMRVASDADGPSVSGDGRFVKYGTGIFPGPQDVYVAGPDPADIGADRTGDGDLDDSVLAVLDATSQTPQVVALGAATRASIASGSVAFLRPEQPSDVSSCNADGDLDDACAYLSVGGAPPSGLNREASEVALTPELVAVLGPGPGGTRLHIWDRPGGPWTTPTAPVADALQAVGNGVAFREAATGNLYVYDHTTAAVIDIGQRAEDFVLGERILAFRTRETTITGSLNGDADTNDNVMRVYDLVSDLLLEPAQAVLPCRMPGCDPRRPYRVVGDHVTFLTREEDQGGQDLDDSGGSNLVIQTYNARAAAEAAAGGESSFASLALSLSSEPATPPGVMTLAGVTGGVCTTTGAACGTDLECGATPGSCFVPPGGCVEPTATTCSINPDGTSSGCVGSSEFCVPTLGDTTPPNGFCYELQGPCTSNADCTAPAFCQDEREDVVRFFGPLTTQSAGSQLFLSAGIEPTGTVACDEDADCVVGEICSEAGTCEPNQKAPIVAGSPDSDGDGLADDFDNCARRANTDQVDLDGDGTGDACDLQTCGDGVQTYGEQCDDAGAAGGCSATCTLPDIACSNGRDDDGDGKTDYPADKGCANASDASERTSAACDNGKDDDGDGRIDFAFAAPASSLDDPGCGSHTGTLEDPKCQNGLNDDGQPGVDFDGGASLGLTGTADPQCTSSSLNSETPPPPPGPGCGLGPELAALLPLLEAWWRQRERALQSSRGVFRTSSSAH